MIPKIIHYCWFGKNPKPKLSKKCIKSWKKYCPDYEIIEWNEDNFDLSQTPLYVRQAYEAKKWAFVTDYVRLKVVYDNGGIYLDTDVELISPIDDLIKYDAYFGFDIKNKLATGLGFGAKKHNKIVKSIMDCYSDILFLQNGEYNLTPCPQLNSYVFSDYGFALNGEEQLIDNVKLLSWEKLNPQHINGKPLFSSDKKTYSIHHDAASWFTPDMAAEKAAWEAQVIRQMKERRIEYVKHLPNRILRKLIGVGRYEKLKQDLKRKR